MNLIDILNNKNFTHLHVHTVHSLLDGYNRPNRLAKRVKELGMTSVAITDHNSLSGVPEFIDACKEEGIKPIIGLEAYYTHDTNILSLPKEERDKLAINAAEKVGIEIPKKATKKAINELISDYAYDTKQYHIVLIAQNQKGWDNLKRLQSEAARKCTYNGRYCVDNSLLRKYNEGLIMTTACIGNAVSQFLCKNKINEAIELLCEWKDIFKERLYLEIQPLMKNEQCLTNYFYYNFSKEYEIKVVATTDSHYTFKEDYDRHDTLLCLGMGKEKSDETRMKYDHEFWIRSYEEMIDAFHNQAINIKDNYGIEISDYINFVEEALNNTNLIAEQIYDDIKIGSNVPLLPKVETPNGLSSEDFLKVESFKNLYTYANKRKAKGKEIDIKKYEKKIYDELCVINPKGYADYMLIYKDLVDHCEKEGIAVGPGRGSAAGSLVLFLNKITKVIDPIDYNLLFFRFLTKDRTALPDVDTDFSKARRPEVIQYLKDKYGADCVANIGTSTELGVKNGIKDVGKALGYDFSLTNSITKQIDIIFKEDPNLSFKSIDKMKNSSIIADQTAYAQYIELEKQYQEIFDIARDFEGIPRNQGMHASGVLVMPCPVEDFFPTRVDSEGNKVVLYSGEVVEKLNGVNV